MITYNDLLVITWFLHSTLASFFPVKYEKLASCCHITLSIMRKPLPIVIILLDQISLNDAILSNNRLKDDAYSK